MFELIKKNSYMHLQGYCMPLVQYFYISAHDDAGTAGVLSGGDYICGVFWAWIWTLGLVAWGP